MRIYGLAYRRPIRPSVHIRPDAVCPNPYAEEGMDKISHLPSAGRLSHSIAAGNQRIHPCVPCPPQRCPAVCESQRRCCIPPWRDRPSNRITNFVCKGPSDSLRRYPVDCSIKRIRVKAGDDKRSPAPPSQLTIAATASTAHLRHPASASSSGVDRGRSIFSVQLFLLFVDLFITADRRSQLSKYRRHPPADAAVSGDS